MADYNINAITRRVVFTGSAGVGPYAFSFEVLDQNDVAVYFNTTSLTLTTDYTVTVNANGTGSVTLVTGSGVPTTPTASDTVIIIGARDIERVTDFVTAGDLLASSLNEQLDALTIFDQQLSEEGQRSMRAPVFDPALVADGGTLDMTLPSAAERAGKNLAFDANGNPEAGEDIGTFRGNWAASTTYYKRDIVKDASNGNIYRVNTEHTSSGTTPISSNADVAKFDLVVDNAAAAANAQLAEDWAKETTSDVNSTGEYSSKAYAIGGTGVTNTSGKGAAKEWATTTGSTVDTSEYSAKEYAVGTTVAAGSAKDWASQASGTVDGSEYSAKYYSGLASTSASNAATSESNAATSATNASNAQTAAEAALDTFDDTYLGAKASAPTVDNDGDPLAVGMLYTNSSSGNLFYYNGSAWVAVTSGGITDIVDDATPQLGGDLDVQTNSIVSTSNQDINITPNGTGNVTLGSFTFDADQTVGAGQDNYVLTYDNTGGLISLEPAAAGGLADVVDDLTPQLGGNLDVNSNSIVSASNGDIAITPNGTGDVIIDGLKHPQADGTNGQHLATNGSGQLSFQNNYTVDVLVVAGGGGGGGVGAGAGLAGGGGAGGFVEGSIKVHTGEAVSVGVGAGGAGGASGSNVGANGSDSSFGGAFIAFGGGGGSPGRDTNVGGSVGGSGGGGGGGGSGSGTTGGTNEINSLPTQGRNGGTGSTVSNYGGGGGGGARVAGVNGTNTNGGNGGDGIIWKSLGTTYAGGGGGAIVSGTVGSGGAGGGGNGGKRGTAPTAGTANTGGGGGGNGQDDTGGAGANGGSGIVIVRYKSATQLGSGGTVTSSGGYQYHTFTSSGTFTG